MKERSRKLFIYFTILVALTIVSSEYNPFIEAVNDIHVFKTSDDSLHQQIKKSAEKYNEDAQDAYIDQVWKKMPGRNGRKVNIEESYKKMKKRNAFDSSLLVFEEIKPEV